MRIARRTGGTGLNGRAGKRLGAAVTAALLAALPHVAAAQVLAFPEAEGFGRFAAGARTTLSAASVYHVTNLNDGGPGSFRDAVSGSNRFVVFDVGGVVNLQSVVSVRSNVTIAGQTAPGGIALYGEKVSFTGANNLVSRHLAVRKGNAGVRDDSVSLARGTNMMFDHMSVTWGVDETFSMNPDSGYVIDNVTIQNTVIAQGLDRLGHSAGGLMTLGEGGRFSVVKSLFADNVTRNPKVRGENEFINNVVYGYQTAGYIMGDTTSMDSHANVEGNYFIEGPVNGSSPFASGTPNFHVYARDNWVDADKDGVLDGGLNTTYPGAHVVAARHAFPTVASLTAQQAVGHVLANVGPVISRDVVDARIVQEVASYGTLGGVILRETDLFPGYGTDPKYVNPRARLADGDNDGMPDNWETARGLSPTNGADWKGLNAAGYTRLEEYLNELGGSRADVYWTAPSGAWTNGADWAGGVPTLAGHALVFGGAGTNGSVSITGGNAFARRLIVGGNGAAAGEKVTVNGGTLDVFDTLHVGFQNNATLDVGGGVVSAGWVLLGGNSGGVNHTGTLNLNAGGTLQTGFIHAAGPGVAAFNWNGGTLRATADPVISVAATLGSAGGTFDMGGYSGVFSGRITGPGRLTKVGAGTLTLAGDNAYTGGTTVTGNLLLAHGRGAGTGAINVTSAGGAVQLAHGVTVANNISTAFNFEVLDVPDAGATATYAGTLTTTGSALRIQASGAGATLNLTGAVSAGGRLFILKSGNVVVAGGGAVTGTGGGVVGRAAGTTSLTVRDNANFSVGHFSMGGGQPLTTGSITVRDNATLSTGVNALDLLSTTTADATAALHLNGGTTTVGGVAKSSVGTGQTAAVYFNGGTLRYGGAAANAKFLPALPGLTAVVKAGGARVNDNGHAVTIAAPLVHDPALGAAADGGLIKSGAGTLTLAAANTFTGPVTVAGGALRVTNSIATAAGVTVQAGGTFDVAATQTVKALAVAAGGRVELRDSTLVIDYAVGAVSPIASMRAALAAGRITSSSLTAATAVGYAEAADVVPLTNGAGAYAGQTVDASSLILRRTLAGDADLDGAVDFDDLVRVAQNYNATDGARIWSQGDYTYDGNVDFNDLVKLAQNYNSALPADLPAGATGSFAEDAAAAFAAVPEPSSVVALGAIGAFVATARRRRTGRA